MKIRNRQGLSVGFLENGLVRSIEAGDVRISLRAATPFSRSGANLWLRKRTHPLEYTALTGPQGNSRFKSGRDGFVTAGRWKDLDYLCILRLSKTSLSWQWSIDIRNGSKETVELDLICVQDVGLKTVTGGLINEYYVSQYIERRILHDSTYGSVICCRQNMKESAGNPWLMVACNNGASAASVDGMQFYGTTCRETGIPEGLLSDSQGGEYAGESSVTALQEKPFTLSPGERRRSSFVALYMHDHPEATSERDLNRLPELMSEISDMAATRKPRGLTSPVMNLFNTSGFLKADDLNETELNSFFGSERRHCEKQNGQLLSFFHGENDHVVLRAKETAVDRPHGHIMQAAAGLVPDENIVSSTAFACGVFSSHITQGNTNFNIFLSVCSDQFNLSPETGQRIFVTIDGDRYLLGVPSAFETGLNHCRWIYKYGGHVFQIRTWTSKKVPAVNMDFRVIRGGNVSLLITHLFDRANGWRQAHLDTAGEYLFRPETGSDIAGKFPRARFTIKVNSVNSDFRACGDEVLFTDNESRNRSVFVLDVMRTSDFCMSFIGEVCSTVRFEAINDADSRWLSDCHEARAAWQELCLNLNLGGDHEDTAAIREILPWYGMNALTHYLTPYGLEQFSGAAWGTRDIAQGPFELLMCMEKYDEARQVLRIIFSNQNPDGGWPQWWMFDSYSDIRAEGSHGDIYYWCIMALSSYVRVTGDLKFLDEIVPWYHEKGVAGVKKSPLSGHVDRLVKMINDSFIPGTALVPFDGGDWNDSLQPVSGDLAKRMISSWTVEMNYQAFRQLIFVYEQSGRRLKAEELKEICENIKADFNRYLVGDGVVAGYGLTEEDGSISLLLHPSDTRTGIMYSILPMDRGIISEIFTPEQARHHQELIEKHLKGPDGARLMDRPLKYHGGIQTLFRRAESSTFFGREIGLMYVHEHIRYAESLAATGRADAFLKALRQAIPVGYSDLVPCSDLRQSNCYYSSSDVAFRNRYEADERYDEIKNGTITLRGGWRIYSSGPGIFIGIIVTRLLGLRQQVGKVIIDPVIPASLDGLTVSMNFMGHRTTFEYIVREGTSGPKAITINGKTFRPGGKGVTGNLFAREENKYRQGGAVIPSDRFSSMLNRDSNTVKILL